MSREPLSSSSVAVKAAVKTIDSLEFARDEREFSVSFTTADFERLQGFIIESGESLVAELRGEMDEQQRPWLHLRLRGELSLVCQRCLSGLSHEVEIDAHLRLIRPGEPWPEDELEEGNEVGADDAIEADAALNLKWLVEEEIILDLPYAPMHEKCELPGAGELNKKASPFAALAVLKKH